MKKGNLFKMKLIGLCIVVAFQMFTGCTSVPHNQIGVFSKASADLAGNAADGYILVNESAIERRIHDIASDTSMMPDETTFENVISDKDLKVRIDLLRAVETYAQALGDLASADFREEIDQASLDLYGALGKLRTTYDGFAQNNNELKPLPLTDKSMSIIAASIDAIGSVIIEKKRRDALKTVIIEADPGIQKSMILASEELSELQTFFSMNLQAVARDKRIAYRKEAETLTYGQRIKRLYGIRQAIERASVSPQIIEALAKSGKKVASAHAALREAVENNKFSSEKLIQEVKDIAELSKSIKDFHDKLTDSQ